MKIAQVLVPYPFDNAFSYLVPEGIEVEVGSLVEVSFRNQNTIGVVWGFDGHEADGADNKKKYKLKEIISLVDNTPLQKELMDFVDWVANYNLIARGVALKMVISSLLNVGKVKVETGYQLAKNFDEEDLQGLKLTKTQLEVVKCLMDVN